MTVTKEDIKKSVLELGIKEGDSVIVHSSLKSLGYVEGGPDAVIDGFLEAVGKDGTLIFPTLCQNDWEQVYENWHIDVPSDVGLITNVFRKREGALRSNQATHSVAAMGKDAKYITETHGVTGKRIGIFGDTPFAADSPWEKMYKMNTKMVFLGVEALYATMRHYAEYVFVENCLEKTKNHPDYEEMKNKLSVYGKHDPNSAWPHIKSVNVYNKFKEEGNVTESRCGEATLRCIEAKPYVDFCIKAMEDVDERYLWEIGNYEETIKWLKRIKEMKGN